MKRIFVSLSGFVFAVDEAFNDTSNEAERNRHPAPGVDDVP